MASDDAAFGGLINRSAIPGILLGICGLLLVLSLFVGWFTVDAKLRRWEYDETNPEGDYVGAPSPPIFKIDLQMKMLSIDTQAAPAALQTYIDNNPKGPPNYDDDAGRMGTVMIGVLLMQAVVVLAFLGLVGFYMLHRRRRHDFGPTVKRMFLTFVAITAICLLYFSLRIGPAARSDEEQILKNYPFSDNVAVAPLKPNIGFWKVWRTDKERVQVPGIGPQVWQFEVASNPSAGWWLTVAAGGLATAARILAGRNGEFAAPMAPPAALTAPIKIARA